MHSQACFSFQSLLPLPQLIRARTLFVPGFYKILHRVHVFYTWTIPLEPIWYLPYSSLNAFLLPPVHVVAVVWTIPSSPGHPKPASLLCTLLPILFGVKGRDATFRFRYSLYMDWYSAQMLIYSTIAHNQHQNYRTQSSLIREIHPESFSAFRID